MDRMDDIWKDRFNSDELQLEDWNSPDDFVWEAVADQTVREQKKKRFVWWMWGLLALLLTIFTVYFLKNNISNQGVLMTEQLSVVTVSESLAVENNNTNTNEEALVNLEILSEKNEASSFTPNISEEKIPLALDQELEKPFAEKNKTLTEVDTQVPNLPIENSFAKEDLMITEKTIIASEEYIAKREYKTYANKLSASLSKEPNEKSDDLDYSVFDLETINVELSNPVIDLRGRQIAELKNKKPVLFSVNVGAAYWKHKISQQYTSDLSAFDFNYTNDLGYLIDLDVDIPLGKRFHLQFGLDYEQINVSSGHNSELSYDPSQESNEANNDYSVTLATPYGLSAAEFSFTRSEEIGEEPVDLLVDFYSAHTIRNFSFPVGFVYTPFGQWNRFSPYVKGGMGVNYLSGISNNISSIDTHHSAIHYNKTGASSFKAPDIKQWHFDYRIGIGASYRWTSNLSLRIHYEYVNGLNAIFQQDNYNTKINRHHFSVGLSRSLSDFP